MREYVTSALELLGALLVVLGIALAISAYSVPGAYGAAGVLLVMVSLVIEVRGRPKSKGVGEDS